VLASTAVAGLLPAAAVRPDTRPFEINVTHGMGAGEPEIAIDPVRHTVVISFMYQNTPHGQPNPDGSRDSGCGVAVSRDRGKTWRVRTTHPTDPGPTAGDPYHQCSDPTAASGARGTLYVGAGWWDSPLGIVDSYNTYVSASTDGGLTWSPTVFATGTMGMPQHLVEAPATPTVDRQWLAADPQTGTVYASVADFPRIRRWIVASHDGGRTFGPPHAIAPATGLERPVSDYIHSAAHGVLAVSYLTAVEDPRCDCPAIFQTSRDDGATWTSHPAPIPAQWTAADPSRPGRFAIMSGGIGTANAGTTPNELLVSVTSDYGRTWSRVVHIGQPPSNERLDPWISYSPRGVLGVAYKTVYEAGYDQWAAISADGGFTFGRPIRISHAVSQPQPSEGGDDYGSVALDEKYLYVAWGDMRKTSNSSASGTERTLFFGRVALPPPHTRTGR
jgi:hypothetical protein